MVRDKYGIRDRDRVHLLRLQRPLKSSHPRGDGRDGGDVEMPRSSGIFVCAVCLSYNTCKPLALVSLDSSHSIAYLDSLHPSRPESDREHTPDDFESTRWA